MNFYYYLMLNINFAFNVVGKIAYDLCSHISEFIRQAAHLENAKYAFISTNLVYIIRFDVTLLFLHCLTFINKDTETF